MVVVHPDSRQAGPHPIELVMGVQSSHSWPDCDGYRNLLVSSTVILYTTPHLHFNFQLFYFIPTNYCEWYLIASPIVEKKKKLAPKHNKACSSSEVISLAKKWLVNSYS